MPFARVIEPLMTKVHISPLFLSIWGPCDGCTFFVMTKLVPVGTVSLVCADARRQWVCLTNCKSRCYCEREPNVSRDRRKSISANAKRTTAGILRIKSVLVFEHLCAISCEACVLCPPRPMLLGGQGHARQRLDPMLLFVRSSPQIYNLAMGRTGLVRWRSRLP